MQKNIRLTLNRVVFQANHIFFVEYKTTNIIIITNIITVITIKLKFLIIISLPRIVIIVTNIKHSSLRGKK